MSINFKNLQKQKYINFIAALAFLFPFQSSASGDGDSTFNNLQIHTIHITLWQPSFWDSLLATHANDTTMPCTVTINGVQLDSVGIKLKGNSSFNSYPGQKKSIKLNFDEYIDTLKYDGLKTINLNNGFKDPTMIREKITLDFLRNKGIPTPRSNFAKVYINGTYWGFYSMVEQVNKTFLNDFIGNKDGNLFKGDPQGTLQFLGTTLSTYYPKYELKTNETANDWSDLFHLIDNINNESDANFYDSLESVLNTYGFIQQWATDILFSNLDSYRGSGHNYYIYHNTASNKFDWITWDVNEAFGTFAQGLSIGQMESLSYAYISNPATSRPITNRMLANPIYKQQYIDILCEYLNTSFTSTELDPIIDSLSNFIRTDYYADVNKMYSNAQFETNLSQNVTVTGPGGGTILGLKSFIINRRNFLLNELAALGCTDNIPKEVRFKNSSRVIPNPFSNQAKIVLDGIENKNAFIQVYNVLGQIVLNASFTGSEYLISTFSPGIFSYQIRTSEDQIFHGKFAVLH